MTTTSNTRQLSTTPARPAHRRRGPIALAAGVAAAAMVVLGAALPANATGMKAITGNIHCNAYPNLVIGTSATARGDVNFQLNKADGGGAMEYVSLGYSSAYAPWTWKFWAFSAGSFFVYAYGSSGDVTAASRWCHNING